MTITVFSKTRQTENGKPFQVYIARLPRKDGGEDTVTVRFRDPCEPPKSCPCNIVIEKGDANLSRRDVTLKSGEVKPSLTLWVAAWEPGGDYEDHSLDDYDI